MSELTHISLFAGIAGIDIAAELAGFDTILFVEKDLYCQKVLKKHWPDVPILEDIFNVTKETIREAMAYSIGRGKQQPKGIIRDIRGWPSNGSQDVADSKGKGLERSVAARSTQPGGCPTEYFGGNWWAVEPELGRVAHGIPNRVDRLKCLGNAVVPQQIYPILKAIADIERGQA